MELPLISSPYSSTALFSLAAWDPAFAGLYGGSLLDKSLKNAVKVLWYQVVKSATLSYKYISHAGLEVTLNCIIFLFQWKFRAGGLYCTVSEKIASVSRKCFIRFINIICHSVSTNVGLNLLRSQASLKSIFIHKVASFFFQVCAPFEHLHIIICEFLPKHSCHLCLSLSLLPQSFSWFPTVMLQRGCSLPSGQVSHKWDRNKTKGGQRC